jgi:hypothetical protein
VFAPISAIFGLLFFASTLPNGIRVGDLPERQDSVEIVAGYASGGLTDFESAPAADAFLRTVYAAGGSIQFVNELDRTAIRIVVPAWAAAPVFDELPSLFKEIQSGDKGSDPSTPAPLDFRGKVESEIREALLGATYSEADYATGDAFVLSSTAPPKSSVDALAAIPKRGSSGKSHEQGARLAAERTLRFKSDLPTGAVIFAAPAPSVYYREWFLLLMLDRLIHRSVPLQLKTSLPLNVRPYYYRIELPLAAGQFPEPAEGNLLQELQRLQFTPAKPNDLSAARQDALAYLDSGDVREWFASHGISERRDEGAQWIGAITADDLRAAVRDLLVMNRVVATWAPKPKETSVSVEPLTSASPSAPQPPSSGKGKDAESAQMEGRIVAFPVHTDSPTPTAVAERLSSGVSLVSSAANAVFVSGEALTRFDHEPTADDLNSFSKYRAERILVFAPTSSLGRVRELWSNFKGSTSGPTGAPKGKVSTGDLGALFLLKTILDLKLIDSGWWRDVELRIDATEGAELQIVAGEEKRAQILGWIKSIATTPLSDKYFAWVREVAIHHFKTEMPELQALTWERDPQGSLADLSSISSGLLQDVAGLYF